MSNNTDKNSRLSIIDQIRSISPNEVTGVVFSFVAYAITFAAMSELVAAGMNMFMPSAHVRTETGAGLIVGIVVSYIVWRVIDQRRKNNSAT